MGKRTKKKRLLLSLNSQKIYNKIKILKNSRKMLSMSKVALNLHMEHQTLHMTTLISPKKQNMGDQAVVRKKVSKPLEVAHRVHIRDHYLEVMMNS